VALFLGCGFGCMVFSAGWFLIWWGSRPNSKAIDLRPKSGFNPATSWLYMSPKAIRLRGYGFLVFGGLAVTVTVVGVSFPDLFGAVVIAAVLLWIAVIVSFAWEYFNSTKPQSDN
jgi:uncharacterized Tic20 family protein